MTILRGPDSHFDVVILGGGPSGASAGLTLLKRDGTSIAVVESSDYSSPRIGESLTPGIRPLLEYLGIWQRFRGEQSLESFGSKAAWGTPDPQALDYMFTLHGTGWALDRVRFDRMLATTFSQRGGNLLTQTSFIKCERRPGGGWDVHVRGLGKSVRTIQCEYLIDATGRAGRLAGQLGVPRAIHDRLVGVGSIGRLSDEAWPALESVILVEACEYGWWYTSPVPGNRIAVVLMSDADIVSRRQAARPDRWRYLLNAMKETSERVRGVRFTQRPKAFSCFSSILRQVGGEDWVAVGDAAASHDPLSSTGIPHAIGMGVHGALAAANSLFSNGESLKGYQETIHDDFLQYLRTHWRYYRREDRWPDSVFWRRRTTPVSIDPNEKFQRVERSTKTIDPNEKFQRVERSTNTFSGPNDLVHLPARFSRQLYESCKPGRFAHQIVREFAGSHPQVPDQQIIFGLQELVANGHVKIDVPKVSDEIAPRGVQGEALLNQSD